MLLVRDVMTASPRTVGRQETVQAAARYMQEEDVGALPVLQEDGSFIGVVTDRDIVLRSVAAGCDARTQPVAEIAQGDPVTVGPEDLVDDAAALMASRQIRRVLVVEENRIVGMVSQADVAREADPAATGTVVAAISREEDDPRPVSHQA